jgi:hypothetical protein
MDKNSDTNFTEQKVIHCYLTLEMSDVGDRACVTDTNFLWENMDTCIRQWEIFTSISEPEDSTKSLTGTSSECTQTYASNHPANSNQPPI